MIQTLIATNQRSTSCAMIRDPCDYNRSLYCPAKYLRGSY